jgi:NAD(P)-dependent dehydrogenase (short-subunit alcohol dehydrogenase family)
MARRSLSRTPDLFLAAGAFAGAIALARTTARRRRRIDFDRRVALVTGGSRGLGLLLARQLAAEGAAVAICARDEAELARAEADLEQRGSRVLAVPCDLTERAEVDAMLARVRRELGPVEVLINNAGSIQTGPMEEMTPQDYEDALRVHFWAPLYTTLGVLPAMRGHSSGRIVNIASIGGKIAVPHLLPYSASKFALVGFSEGLRGALVRHGIYVTTVCPGLMRTGSPRNALFKGRYREEYAWFSIADSLPLLSMSAARAATRILDACRYGDAELTMPLTATAAIKCNALFPGIGMDLLGLTERVLPGPGGIGAGTRRGAESESRWSPSLLTALTDRAAERNNQLGTSARSG